jgi:hypothetical protein
MGAPTLNNDALPISAAINEILIKYASALAEIERLKRIEEWADEGNRVRAQRCEGGWIVTEEPEWNATLYIDPGP